MKKASPLRYPGGKSAMADLLIQIRKLNGFGAHSLAEPFAGGAGASLTLLYLEETKEIFINDADPAIHDFWWSLVNKPRQFLDCLSNSEVTIDEWRRQREIYGKLRISRTRRGFAAFFLNRCNRSGIVATGGPIGGVNQTGKWKLNARFNKVDLLRRCGRVAEYGERINVLGKDGMEFIESTDTDTTMFFIDPPYFGKGPTLYLDSLDEDYHCALASLLMEMKDDAWVLTYDDCPEIRGMYSDWANIRPYSLRYTASSRRFGNEILIVPKWMKLPDSQSSAVLKW